MRRDDQTDAYGRRLEIEPQSDEQVSEQRHKKSYEAFFEGYTPETSVKPNGKTVTYRVYTGDINRQNLDDVQRRRVKLYYGALLVAALLLSTAALCLPTGSNYHVWLFIPGLLPSLFIIRQLFAFSHYLTAGRDMKVHEFRSGSRVFVGAAKPAIVITGAVILTTVILLLVFRLPIGLLELLRLLMLSFAGLIPILVSLKEQQIEYIYIPAKRSQSSQLQ